MGRVPTLRDPDHKRISTIRRLNGLHSYPDNPWFYAVAEQTFQSLLFSIKIGFDPNQIGRQSSILIHADDDVAPRGISERRYVLQKFFVAVGCARIKIALVFYQDALEG